MFEIASPGHEVQTPPEGVPSRKPTTDGEMIIPPMLSLKPREDTTPKLQNQFKKPYPINRQFAPLFPRTAGSENEAGNRYGASNENRVNGNGPQARQTDKPVAMLEQPWVPGTFGFGSDPGSAHGEDSLGFDKHDTLPMIVLKGISRRQGEGAPAMQSEISGAAGGAATVGLGSLLGNFLKYGNNLLIQRGFGAGPFGLYTLGMSTVTLVVSIFNLGLDDAMVRYVSIYKERKQANLLVGLAIFCSVMAGIAGLLGALLVLFFAPLLAALRNAPNILPLLLLMSPLVPIASMQGVWTGGLQGLKAFKWRILVQRFVVPGTLTILLLLVVFFFRDLTWVVVATLLSSLIGAVANLYFFFRMVSSNRRAGREEYQLREWLSFALPNFLTSILDTVLESVDTLLLATLVVSIVSIGQYAAAIKISSFIAVPLQTFNVMFAPTIAELHSKGEKQKLTIMFKVVTSWIITFSLPIFLIAVLFSKPLLGISGPSFAGAWPLLIALAAGNLVNSGTGSVGYMLLMTGHQKLSFLNSLVAVGINVVLGIILTPMYGAMGTAIATGIALAAVNLMRLLQVQLLLKMNPYRWDTFKPLAAGLISSLMTGGLLYLLNITPLSFQFLHLTLDIQLALVPVFLVSYVVLLALLDVSPEDKIVLDKLRGKFKGGKKKKAVKKRG